ncbi:UDP-N-acetylmuramate dehydrogenase [Olsenella sp. HMSC062G07]|uniref:UDP-N-acetylmuramate dehydrogenase n=1 Tax=Olsenella sp. HMSC062G07 TaxID=1739330 RepID=UPI0008A418AD|nr:UDP-N-acetylmuramate dehydrogenase [Olsenella sp. HMSC062G07]OFK24874.1 UDP-N-acetylenolpyruvoylglucosamine reductase [Olsenella sp. HMSC062G07]
MSLFNAYMSLSGAIDGEVLRDERLAHRTSWRIGGPADLFVRAHSLRALTRTLEVLGREGMAWVILGKGSNVLVSDEGYRGCVIELGCELSRVVIRDDGLVTAGAGVPLPKLLRETLTHCLGGLEFCMGIPGTLGGAVALNAGTRERQIGQLVESVVVTDRDGRLARLAASDIEWGRRYADVGSGTIILEADLRLVAGDKAAIAAEMNRYVAQRRRALPLGAPSGGAVFRDPPDESAARLIGRCGLRGATAGGAQVSATQGNVIVNRGGATAQDVITLMGRMHDAVLDRFGLDLAPDVKFLGFGT